MNTSFYRSILIFLLIGLITACASPSKNLTVSSKPQAQEEQEQQIIGNIPAGSPFSKLKIGMSSKQVHDLIGEPTDTISQITGKMFIPFYFGSDNIRMIELYKGQGRITFTGDGNYKIYQITYDPSEDGYNNN